MTSCPWTVSWRHRRQGTGVAGVIVRDVAADAKDGSRGTGRAFQFIQLGMAKDSSNMVTVGLYRFCQTCMIA